MFKDIISSVYTWGRLYDGAHVEVGASPVDVIILSFYLGVALGNET